MKNYQIIKNGITFFSKWRNQSFAIFSSLKKVVKISSLPIAYTLILSQPSLAQIDSVRLEEITVESSRIPLSYMETSSVVNIIDKIDIAHLPVHDIQDLLNYALSVDVRQRGLNGVQSDVSIRGGSFEQTLILLNGVKVNDAQTGHHNMNLPVDIESVERIEILQGPGARIYGPSAFSGAINIITNSNDEKFIKANVGGGEHGFRNLSFSSSYNFNQLNNYFSYSYKESEGFTDNTDFENSSLFYQVSKEGNLVDFSGQAGYLNKSFGANSFYTAAFPEQFEKTKTFFASGQLNKNINKLKITPSVYWRRHQDHFLLERNNPDFYENNHLTNTIGGDLKLIYEWQFGVTALGFEYRNESILSTRLGEPMTDSIEVPGEPGSFFYNKKDRDDLSLFFQQNINLGDFNFDLGLITYYKSDYDWEVFPGVNIGYEISEKMHAFAGYNFSFRVPTFTELYYSSPTNQGNLNLKPEKSATLDVGIKYLNKSVFSQFSVFYRDGTDLIDWALDTSGIYVSRNVNNIKAYGFESEIRIYFNNHLIELPLIESFKVNYSYLEMDKSSGSYTSLYILDFLKQKFVAQTNFSVTDKVGFSFMLNYQDRAGTYTEFISGSELEYEPFSTIDANIHFKTNRFKFYFYVNNLLDKEYADLANIPMPGRWIKLGLKYNLPL